MNAVTIPPTQGQRRAEAEQMPQPGTVGWLAGTTVAHPHIGAGLICRWCFGLYDDYRHAGGVR